jgi:copper(I)-binding protein
MRKIPAIDLPANETTVLQPGSLHVMFINLKQDLSLGQDIDLKLNFSDGSSQQLSVPVKEVMKPGMKQMGGHKDGHSEMKHGEMKHN